MFLESRGYKVKVIVRILWEILAKGKHANMAAEGDDGLHVFTKAFLEIFDGPKNFGKEWCATYKEYGFKIEPQGNQGEVRPEECLLPTCERVEFCSRIHVATGDYTHSFPKPSKVAQSLSTSFNTAVSRHDACATEAVALMASCMKQPLLFELCATMYETHRKCGGHAIGDVLEKEWSIKEIYNGFVERELDNGNGTKSGHKFYVKLLNDHLEFLSDGATARMMMEAMERETGISVQDQEELMISLRGGNRDIISSVVRALRE